LILRTLAAASLPENKKARTKMSALIFLCRTYWSSTFKV
jgi:hypothetical protein